MTANLLILTREKREFHMKRLLMPATAMAAVLVLLLFVPGFAFSQQLQSGALLTITSSDGKVNRAVYDSQIHSGTVQAPACDKGLVTDAYVLQGGSSTGCDTGDNYEVTDASNNISGAHQLQGNAMVSGNGYSFTITTFYLCGFGQDSGNACTYPTPLSTPPNFTPPMNGVPVGPFCNTNNTICTNPDTGFLAVTVNSVPAAANGSFTGTISLAGTSPTGGLPYCPTNGVALDSIPSMQNPTGTIPVGSTWVFALSPDSSNCGGFTQSQTKTLTAAGTAGATVTFPFGPDESGPGPLPGADYILAGITNTGGETIKFDLVPVVQAGNLNAGIFAPNTFNFGANFPGFTCDPYGDLSEVAGGTTTFLGGTSPNHVCAEVHLDCSVPQLEGPPVENGGDCTTFFYTLTADYTLPSDVFGAGNALLEDSVALSCPSSSWNANIFETVTVDEVKKKGGSNPASSCFVAANGVVNGNPAPLVQQGQTFVSFEGLEFPFTLKPPKFNPIIAGWIAPLSFDYIAPNLTSATFTPQAIPISCSTGLPTGAPAVAMSGNLVNLTKLFPKLFPVENGLTEYLFNWQTVKGSKGCVSVVFNFQGGPSVFVTQEFKYF